VVRVESETYPRDFARNLISTLTFDGTRLSESQGCRCRKSSYDLNLTNDLSGPFNSGFPPDDLQPAWSPEGTQIAYTRSALGTELHVMNFDGTANLTLIATQATMRSPVWVRPGASSPPEKASTTTSLSLSTDTSVYGEAVIT